MIPVEYPLGQRVPGPGETIALRPGLHWLRMPLPSALKHINLWLLEDGDGWTIVDCGICSDALKQLWEQAFAATLGERPVHRVIATHLHSDHLGLAHWLCERSGGELWISAGDYRRAEEMIRATAAAFGPTARAHLLRHGVADEKVLDQVRRQPSPYPSLVPSLPSHFHPIADGDEVHVGDRTWRSIAGYGHAPEHMAFHCASLGTLIGGDMLLPEISTYVGVSAMEPDANPLPQYLDSIARLTQLPDSTLLLPSHGRPFIGIAARVAQLRAHHDVRLGQVLDACATPHSAADLVPALFPRPLDTRNYLLAIGETLAHLQALAGRAALTRARGADGVIRFVRRTNKVH